MARKIYRVQPLPDGVNQRGNWQVKRNGSRIDTHTKKSAAERTARSEANVGDVIVIHRTDGSIQNRFVVRGSRSSNEGGSDGVFAGFGPWDDVHGDPFWGN